MMIATVLSPRVRADDAASPRPDRPRGYATVLILEHAGRIDDVQFDAPHDGWRIVGLRLDQPHRRGPFYPKLLVTVRAPNSKSKVYSISPGTLAKLGLSLMDFRKLASDPEQTLGLWVDSGHPHPAITYLVAKTNCAFELAPISFKQKD